VCGTKNSQENGVKKEKDPSAETGKGESGERKKAKQPPSMQQARHQGKGGKAPLWGRKKKKRTEHKNAKKTEHHIKKKRTTREGICIKAKRKGGRRDRGGQKSKERRIPGVQGNGQT